MLKKLLTSALFAGFGAGLITALLQISIAVPVILEAELYETGQKVHYAGVVEMVAPDHIDEHDAEAEANAATRAAGEVVEPDAPVEGFDWSRNVLTFFSVELNFISYALLLVAAMALATRRGVVVNARSGILWGLAGFAAFSLSPALGLPPELPGSVAADLALRQVWWIGTVIATIIGLAAIGFGKNWLHWGLGILAIALPHIIGAPHAGSFGGVVPPELQGEFVGLALAISAVGWGFLGLFAGHFWGKEAA